VERGQICKDRKNEKLQHIEEPSIKIRIKESMRLRAKEKYKEGYKKDQIENSQKEGERPTKTEKTKKRLIEKEQILVKGNWKTTRNKKGR